MACHYPNLELLDYIATKLFLINHDPAKRFIPDYDVRVFSQLWGNTGGGMARKGFCYGDAMTREYTTVFINHNEDAAIVFFSNRPAYMVKPIPGTFYTHLHRNRMAGIDETECYGNENVSDLSSY